MDIWSDVHVPKLVQHSNTNKEHPMDILIKDDKRTKPAPKKGKTGKCIHTWKELDKGRVHKDRYRL